MEWVDILTPSAAVFAALVAIGLAVQIWRQGRHIRRLEERLGEMGGAATDAPLQRLTELQQRMRTSQGGTSRAAGLGRNGLIAVGAVLAVLVLAGGAWMFLRGGGDGSDGTATPAGTPTTAQRTTTTASAPPPDPGACRNPRPLDDNGLATVTVFNASGVTGAANDKIAPIITANGYTLGLVDNPPDLRSDLRRSQVQFVKPADRNAACNVAKDLGLNRVSAMEGYTVDQIGGSEVNVVVVVGKDLANR